MAIQDSKKTENIQVRVQRPTKEKVELVFRELGLTTSQAINLFFKQVINKNGLPFNVSLDYDPIPLTGEEIESIKRSENSKGILVDVSKPGELEAFLNKL